MFWSKTVIITLFVFDCVLIGQQSPKQHNGTSSKNLTKFFTRLYIIDTGYVWNTLK